MKPATIWTCVVLSCASLGCNQKPAAPAAPKPQEVKFVVPSEEVVTEYEEFTGRTASPDVVDIRARVSGYLIKANFKDGATVSEGEVLFEIDPRSYKAEADRAVATIEQLKARIDRLQKQDVRGRQLLQTNSISQDAYDVIAADLNEAKATLVAAEATRELADLNVSFTKVICPINGKISRRLVDPGNLVKADDTLLATVVTVDPLFVYFDMNERTLLRIRRMRQEGRLQSASSAQVKVQLALADETDFHHEATINFVDNQVDPATGTLRFRAELANTRRFLTPGLFVRLRFPIGDPHPSLLVPEESLATDQGQRCVYVIGPDDVVSYRRVQVGVLTNGKRVIHQGLEANERVAITGLQRIRPGQKVNAIPFEDKSSVAEKASAANSFASEKAPAASHTTSTQTFAPQTSAPPAQGASMSPALAAPSASSAFHPTSNQLGGSTELTAPAVPAEAVPTEVMSERLKADAAVRQPQERTAATN